MTLFIVVCGLLVAATLGALLAPLLIRRAPTDVPPAADSATVYRDQLAELDAELAAGRLTQEQWSAATAEIERRVLEDHRHASAGAAAAAARAPATAVTIGLAVPLLAVALYVVLGSPEALSPMSPAASKGGHEITQAQIEQMVAKLAARLETTPDDADGWYMLARSYGALGRHQESAAAYARLTRLRPNDAQLLADHADMLALAQGRNLSGEPEALIRRALAVDPDHPKALALAGTIAYQRGDLATALKSWRRVLEVLPPESPLHASMKGAVAEVEAKLGLAPSTGTPPPAAAPAPAPRAGASGATLQGRVALPAGLAAKRKPDDTVFVFARAADGPRMPLAVLRRSVKDLPFDFTLDDSMAMSPEMPLSKFAQVVVVVRISAGGSASAQKGDLEAISAPVAPGAAGIAFGAFRTIE